MRYENSQRLFSATDLMNYVGCMHSTWLDLHCPPSEPETEVDEEAKLLQAKGIEHERKCCDRLAASGLLVTAIDSSIPLNERLEQTLQAIKRGDDVLYQAALMRDDWHGFVDFLTRIDAPSILGAHSYEISDAKLAHSAKPKYLVQLCIYAYLLELHQGHLPRSVSLFLGDGTLIRFNVADFIHYVTIARQRFSAFVADSPSKSQPEPCAHCEQCRWQAHCTAEWESTDHLCRIANIQRSQIRKLNDMGIHTVKAFVALPLNQHVPRISPDTLKRLRAQATLQLHKQRTGEDRVELIVPIEPVRGLCRLPKSHSGDIFFDMEGDPHFPDGLEYLFGCSQLKDGKLIYRDFWGHSREGEKTAFEATMDFLTEQLTHFPQAHIYHYSQYEPNALKRLADSHGIRDQQLDWMLRNQKFVDLYKVVREGVRTSQPGYSLKDIEHFYLEKRSGQVQTAGGSVVMYEKWLASHDDTLLNKIAIYNEEDCLSTFKCREWLLNIRPKEATWFTGEVEELGAEKLAEIKEGQHAKEVLISRLLSCKDEVKPMRTLVSQLLDFHRREQKPEYWRMFSRRDDYLDDDFIDDADCLGPLTLSPKHPAYPVKQSTVYTYTFPEQDTKFAVGHDCQIAATLSRAGEIVALDLSQRIVSIERGDRNGDLPTLWSAIPMPPLNNDSLRDALYRFAQAEADLRNTYAAVRRLLLRELPSIRGLSVGRPVVVESDHILKDTIDAIARLDHSYLLIQGPPGSGKTFSSSHIIVDLLARGKRVGVSSNSHKAIHNLLRAIEQVAKERHVQVRGVKKASGQNKEDSFYEGEFFKNVTKNADVTRAYNLVAGTVYLFAELEEQVDYLFVDEAGQVSLANLVVMGMAANNIVLVGDQMQLGQPIQGSHPGESGFSVLDYLLRDQATIRAERGVFLPTTYRMHQDVCRFISEAVYEGRLRPAAENQRQRLILAKHADARLRSTGLQFVEVQHQNCSQRSEAEGTVVCELYKSLLTQHFIDREGTKRPIGLENILVIAPYNVQVNYLKSVLPPGARVGTVDKFQGQEAEIVLISMTTSSGDELPRDFEFLYSKNRLNVAISRSRILSCVIASRRLLEVKCNSVEQMKLVNTLCWARQYAQSNLPQH